MHIKDLSHRITSKKLNENLARNFGYELNLEQFSNRQLEDARNKLRTTISQIEMTESYDRVNESQDYQKTKMFLNVINQEICEREMTESDQDTKAKDVRTGMKKSMNQQYRKAKGKSKVAQFASIRKRAMDHSIPESWIQGAIHRMHLGESDHAELSAELSVRYDLNESQINYILSEGEEEKAEVIMATKDMVDRITGWLEDVATMKAEQLLELLDVIKAEHGSDVAQRYTAVVKPGLEALYDMLEQSRGILNQGLAMVSGGEVESMGAPEMTAPEMGAPEMTAPEMGAPAMQQSREQRESIDYSRKLGMMLSSQKKK